MVMLEFVLNFRADPFQYFYNNHSKLITVNKNTATSKFFKINKILNKRVMYKRYYYKRTI